MSVKPRPNDSNISTQHIPTMLAQYLQALAKRLWKHLNATDCNIVGRSMLHAFSHPVETCCDMLPIENRTSAHASWAQRCCTNLAKWLQHHATPTNIAWKIWPLLNFSQQHPTCCNMLQHVATGWPNVRSMLQPTMLRCVALKCCDRLGGAAEIICRNEKSNR